MSERAFNRIRMSRGRALATLGAFGGAAVLGGRYALADDQPPHGSPVLRTADAAPGLWFIPEGSGFYAEVRKPLSPATDIVGTGTPDKLILNGSRDLGVDFRLNMSYRWHKVGTGTVRGALHCYGLADGTRVIFTDAVSRVKDVMVVRGGGYAGAVLPDADTVVQARFQRPDGIFSPIEVNIGNVSESDARMPMATNIVDLADSFNLPKFHPLLILPEDGVPAANGLPLPHYNFADLSADPKLYGKWTLPNNDKGESWNNAVRVRLNKPRNGIRYYSNNPLGSMGVKSEAGSEGQFEFSLQIDPKLIKYYTYDQGGPVAGAVPLMYVDTSFPEQVGTKISLLDRQGQPQRDSSGRERMVPLDAQGNAFVRLPMDESQLNILVQLATPSKAADLRFRFGPLPPTYTPNPQSYLDGDAGALRGVDIRSNPRVYLPVEVGGSVYIPNQR